MGLVLLFPVPLNIKNNHHHRRTAPAAPPRPLRPNGPSHNCTPSHVNTISSVDERPHVRPRRGYECVEVVAALEDADDRQSAAPQRRRLRREPGEVVIAQLQRGHRVVGVRVEAGREEDCLGVEGPDRGQQVLGPRLAESLGAAAGGQRRAHDLTV